MTDDETLEMQHLENFRIAWIELKQRIINMSMCSFQREALKMIDEIEEEYLK